MRHSTLSILLLFSACGDSPKATPDAAIDAAIDAAVDAVPVTSDAAGTCKVVADVGAVIIEMNIATAIPTPLGGGPIPDGTYKLTALSKYTGVGGATGPTGAMGSETSYLAGGLSHLVTTVNDTPMYAAFTIATNGTTIDIAQTCPTSSATTFDGYTSSSGVVTFYDSLNSLSREFTLTP